MKKLFTLLFFLMLCISSYALTFKYNGITYLVVSTENRTVNVWSNNYPSSTYSGDLEIPETAVYEDIEFTVTGIGEEAFVDDSKLTGLTLPKTITTIGKNAIVNCQKLKFIKVSEENPMFCDIDGVLFSKDKTELLQYPNAKGSTYSLPSSTKKIGKRAFITCLSLKKLTLNEGLEEIDESAFYHDDLLSELSIPSSVTKIGAGAFSKCKLSNLWIFSNMPFYITNTTFPEDMYISTKLYVPQGCIDNYKSANYWKNFYNIEEFDTSGISNIDNNECQIEKVYSINGASKTVKSKGLLLIKMKNGKTKKIINK